MRLVCKLVLIFGTAVLICLLGLACSYAPPGFLTAVVVDLAIALIAWSGLVASKDQSGD